MTFAPANLSDATYRVIVAAQERLREELHSVETGETTVTADELSYMQAKLNGLDMLVEEHKRSNKNAPARQTE